MLNRCKDETYKLDEVLNWNCIVKFSRLFGSLPHCRQGFYLVLSNVGILLKQHKHGVHHCETCGYSTEHTFRCPWKPAREDRTTPEAHAAPAPIYGVANNVVLGSASLNSKPSKSSGPRKNLDVQMLFITNFVELWTNWNTKEVFGMMNGFSSFLIPENR